MIDTSRFFPGLHTVSLRIVIDDYIVATEGMAARRLRQDRRAVHCTELAAFAAAHTSIRPDDCKPM